MIFLNKLKNNLLKLKKHPSVQCFMLHNRRVFPIAKEGVGKRPVVLFELNSMQSAHIAYSYLANVLADLNGAEIKAYAPYSFSKHGEYHDLVEFGVLAPASSYGDSTAALSPHFPNEKNRLSMPASLTKMFSVKFRGLQTHSAMRRPRKIGTVVKPEKVVAFGRG
jgi:hypothetical protein